MKDYLSAIVPLLSSFKLIKVSWTVQYKVRDMVPAILGLESISQMRDKYEGERFHENFSGKLLSTYAVGKLLEEQFIDFNPMKYNKNYQPSLNDIGLDIGINYIYYGDYHLVKQKPLRPEILVIRKNNDDFLICGYASKQLLKKNQEEAINLSLSKYKGMAVFTGYDKLVSFETTEDLKELLNS